MGSATGGADVGAGMRLREVGRYRLVEEIGEGGMGVVHLATDPTGSLVAVKLLRPSVIGGADGRARMAREVATMQRVRGPRVAEVLDADLQADPPYLVTRYVRGPSLHEVVGNHGPLRPESLKALACGLVEALASVHAADVVHRDVKPANVLMSSNGPVLIDFGIARASEDLRLTMTGVVPGTPAFLAPETLQGQPPQQRTDVHGWAATLVYAASGCPPYGSGHDAVVLDRIRRDDRYQAGVAALEELRAAGEADLAQLIHAGLAPDPADRPTLSRLALAFDVAMAGLGTGSDRAQAASPLLGHPVPGRPVAASTRAAGGTQVDPVPPTRVDAPPAPSLPAGPAAPRAAAPSPRDPWAVPGAQAVGTTYGAPVARVAAVTLSALAAVVTAFAIFPAVVGGLLVAAAAVGRATWRADGNLRERRYVRGRRRTDALGVAARTPLFLLTGTLGALAQAIVAGTLGLATGLAVAMLADAPQVAPLSAGLVTAVLMWWGPASRSARLGTRLLSRPMLEDARAAWLVAACLLVLAWVNLMAWESYGTTWDPLPPLLADWLG